HPAVPPSRPHVAGAGHDLQVAGPVGGGRGLRPPHPRRGRARRPGHLDRAGRGAAPVNLEPVTLEDARAARERLGGVALGTPLVRLQADAGGADVFLKLESLQPIGSFKVRGAGNALLGAPPGALAKGVYTASAGNMAQGVAFWARRLGVPCTALVPDNAPETKLSAIARLGAASVKLPYAEWWDTLVRHGREGQPGFFVHPVSDPAVMAGNSTIAFEIAEALPQVDAVLVPYG